MPSASRHLKVASLLVSVLLAPLANAAELYAEARAYPAGGIFSVGALLPYGQQLELGVSALYNVARRGNAGEHDDESGEGFGLGFEARRFHAASHEGWFYGVRAELFQLEIDWRDPGNRRGNTDITVLQPTARLGYRWPLPGSQLSLELAGGVGAEINLATDGEAVGEGAMAGVTHIQRVATKGGVAPALPCAMGNMGQKQVVAYQADYIFWKAAM